MKFDVSSVGPSSERNRKKFSFIFFPNLFPPDEGPTLETLDFTIRIGSTPAFSYFDVYLYSTYAAHCVYICSSIACLDVQGREVVFFATGNHLPSLFSLLHNASLIMSIVFFLFFFFDFVSRSWSAAERQLTLLFWSWLATRSLKRIKKVGMTFDEWFALA